MGFARCVHTWSPHTPNTSIGENRWPKSTGGGPTPDAERGRRLLSDSIYRVNRAFDGDAITGTGDDLRLNRGLVASDVADFEAAVDARDWRRAIELYAGPSLDGFFLPGSADFDQWMERERAQFARTFAKALETVAVEAREQAQ